MNPKRLIIAFVILAVVALVGFWSYDNLFYPAYASTLSNCNPRAPEILNGTGWVTAGTFEVNGTSGEQKITVRIDFPDQRVLKHEIVHATQYRQMRLFHCDQEWKVYANEWEAYIGSRLPRWIFERVYGEIPN